MGFDSDQPKKRQRRNRTMFSNATIVLLEKAFIENKYPDIKERITLAKQINEEEARVQVWFQNRRARHRRSRRRPSTNSDSPSSGTSSSPKSSPSPPPTVPLKHATWLQLPTVQQQQQFLCINSGLDIAKEVAILHEDRSPDSTSYKDIKDMFSYPPPPISPLPRTPTRTKVQRQRFSLWSPLPSLPEVSPMPIQPTTIESTNILRLPLTTPKSSFSIADLSESEVRSADDRFCFTYQFSM
ncbi:paired box protein Pax-6-like [Mytilus californianus]|uniref:paired box protein Pax-6-like n=1 Tax=Mytilus californianus TaxID=6549 RepID=UPI002247BE1C|nr:paired box protein Pax-6-like [Mytilus californianus]